MAPIVGLGLELLEQVPLDYDAPAGEPSLGKLHQRRLGAALPKERIWQLQVGHCPPAPEPGMGRNHGAAAHDQSLVAVKLMSTCIPISLCGTEQWP